MLVMQIE